MTRSLREFAVWILIALACLGGGGWLRTQESPEWLRTDPSSRPPLLRPWMVEADCYSQLARVQRILHGDGLIQNHFKVENWPEGMTPSTTAPFDYAILLLYAPLKIFTTLPLDWAGALVSPVLWSALILFWIFFRSREFTGYGRVILLLGAAALPGFLWATAFGRPRHQSLILVLFALGFTAEYERWNMAARPRLAWSVFAGLVWGLACWTSLFEPALIVTALVAFNLTVRRRESGPMLIAGGGVLLVALLLEGFHIYLPAPEYRGLLVNWLGTIAEVRGLSFRQLLYQLTPDLLLLPFIARMLWARPNFNRTDRLLILLTLYLIFASLFQRRWSYYAGLSELFLLARYCQTAPLQWFRVVIVGLFALSITVTSYWEVTGNAAAPPNQPSPQLKIIAGSIDTRGGILAPWWLSPGLLYFSGQPIVAGSSHCGISGIVASAQFFTATSWTDAEQILRQRQVVWIVVADDPRYLYPLLNTSRGILGLPFYTEDAGKNEADATVAQTLINDRFVPTWLHLRAVTSQLKLYQYVPLAESRPAGS